MRMIFALAVAAAALTAPASAQSDRSASAQAIVNVCLSRLPGAPQTACVCIADALSEHTTDRQYEIMGRTVQHTGNPDGMRAEVERLMSEGYSSEEIRATGEILGNLVTPVSTRCSEG